MRALKPILLSLVVAVSAAIPSYAGSVADLKDRQQQLKDQSAAANSALQETRKDKSEAQAEIDAIDESLTAVTDEVNFIADQLEQVTEELNQTVDGLARAETERDTQYEVFKERARFMYMNGSVGYLDILFKANNFSDFLSRLDYINMIMTYDKGVLQKLEDIETSIAEHLDNIERQKREIEVLKSQAEKRQADLVAVLLEKKTLLENLSRDEEKYAQQIADLEAADKEVEALIKKREEEARRAAAAAARPQVVYSGGTVEWPLPGYSRLSSSYESRVSPINGKREFHTGLDIPAPTGTGIIAAESGTVIFSGVKGSYGKAVIIDHGNGMSTLYAHCSSLIASEGDVVKRGQTIAKVGSTGNSTGPHLHFEVRIGGVHKDPRKYL